MLASGLLISLEFDSGGTGFGGCISESFLLLPFNLIGSSAIGSFLVKELKLLSEMEKLKY